MSKPMAAQTLKALKGSIRKWERIVTGEGYDAGRDNCPLCKVFLKKPRCGGCPVAIATGKPNCEGSPYWKFVDLDKDESGLACSTEQRKVALAELRFLESLLPKGSRNARQDTQAGEAQMSDKPTVAPALIWMFAFPNGANAKYDYTLQCGAWVTRRDAMTAHPDAIERGLILVPVIAKARGQ